MEARLRKQEIKVALRDASAQQVLQDTYLMHIVRIHKRYHSQLEPNDL